jgi:hypothetical protein
MNQFLLALSKEPKDQTIDMEFIKSIASLLVFLIIPSGLYSQNLITKDSAINIALANGLLAGLSEYEAELQGDSVWIVKSLLCDDNNEQTFRFMYIDAASGKPMKDVHVYREIVVYDPVGQIERTVLNAIDINLDSLPEAGCIENRKLTALYENESNPVFSDNDEMIAFHYGFRNIGIISVNGDRFQQICTECLYPQWLDNDWLVYFKDFNHIYRKNIKTGEEIRITENPYRYDNFKLSPDKKWIVYESDEMWPAQDSLGSRILYVSVNGAGQNLSLISTDGKIKRYFDRRWDYYSHPAWSPNSDTIFFYISANKYIATDFSTDPVQFRKCNLLQNFSLWEYEKIQKGTFPFIYECQVLEVDAGILIPLRILIEKRGRYRDVTFSANKKYLLYSKAEFKGGDYSLWIKRLK